MGSDDEALALYFDKLNDKNNDAIEEVKKKSKQILTFSHFVPRLVLTPPIYGMPLAKVLCPSDLVDSYQVTVVREL